MTNSFWGKLFGWVQFGLQVLGNVAQGGAPHGVFGWIGLVGSLATAVAVHNASSTDGQK